MSGMSPGRSIFESESIRMLILRTAIPYSMAMSAMNYGMETRVIRAKLLSDSSRLDSSAITRFSAFKMRLGRYASLEKCSAQ